MQLYTDKAEVLELVVTFTHDVALLAKATVLSSYYRDIALASVQQQLPQLLVHAVKQADDQGQDQVQWCTGCKHPSSSLTCQTVQSIHTHGPWGVGGGSLLVQHAVACFTAWSLCACGVAAV